MPWFLKLVSDAEAYTSSFTASGRPAKRDSPSWMNCHRASGVAPGTRLVVAMAPEFTMGFVRPSGLCSTAASELKGSPVALTPSLSRTSSRAQRLAHQREHERLGHAHDRELVIGVAGAIDAAAGRHDRDAEQIARHPGQRRIDGRHRPVVIRPIALVRVEHEGLHALGGRQAAGGHEVHVVVAV